MTNEASESQTVIGSLLLSGTALLVLLMGATGNFDLDLANIGRLIVYSFGVLLLSYSIEAKHKITESIDSSLSNLAGMETNYKQNRQMITAILLILILLTGMAGLHFLSQRSFTLFTLFISLCATIVGITTARFFSGSNVNIASLSPTGNSEQKIREYMHLKSWLDGDASTVISSVQMDHIQRQRELFEDEIETIIGDSIVYPVTMTSLEEFLEDTVDEPDDFIEMLWNKELKPAHTDWLDGVVNYIKEGQIRQMRDLLGRLLTLPVLIRLLKSLSTPQEINLDWKLPRIANLFRRLLKQSERSVKLLQGYGFSSTSLDHRLGTEFTYVPEYDQFVLFLAYSSSRWDGYDFSPWWLLSARVLIARIDPLNEASGKLHDESNWSKQTSTALEGFEEWCFCVSEYLSEKSVINHTSPITKVTEEIRELKTTTFDRDLIQISWYAYQRLS